MIDGLKLPYNYNQDQILKLIFKKPKRYPLICSLVEWVMLHSGRKVSHYETFTFS